MDQPKIKQIYRLIVDPGLWRDYSTFSSPGCVDALWFRFYHGRLRRMGGFTYVTRLNAFTLTSNFNPNVNSPNGNPNTEPSYPSKQYINQDLTKPWDANFKDGAGDAYNNYNFNNPAVLATFPSTSGVTGTGYRVIRKVLNVPLFGVNSLIMTADYNEPNYLSDADYGGIAFAQVLDVVSETDSVNGRFPAGFGYLPNNTYTWSLDSVNLTTGGDNPVYNTYIVAHAANVGGIADPTDRYVFLVSAAQLTDGQLMSPISSSTPVTALTPPYATEVSVSGGVCACGPFLFAYGNNGLIRNSDANNPIKWANPAAPGWQYAPGLSNDVNVGSSKIVKGISVRGFGTYACLFWSLDSLILGTFVGAPSVFSYTTLATNISIIAPNSVVERSGTFFWLGDGRFFSFMGGQIQEIPNNQNRNWFFSNINQEYQHLAWGCLNPQYSEIWWFFPFGDSTECNQALIFNYETNCWYDTAINRSAGTYSSILNYPLWADNRVDPTYDSYDLYLHEYGNDKIDSQGQGYVIPCYFTTGDIGYLSSQLPAAPKTDSGLIQNWLELIRIEPDALLTGEWTMDFKTRRYANSPVMPVLPQYGFNQATEKVDMRIMGRIMQMTISSSSYQSSFYLGSFMITSIIGDGEGY